LNLQEEDHLSTKDTALQDLSIIHNCKRKINFVLCAISQGNSLLVTIFEHFRIKLSQAFLRSCHEACMIPARFGKLSVRFLFDNSKHPLFRGLLLVGH